MNKTRCDGGGGLRCTLCAQRAVDCSYRGSRPADRDDGSTILATQPRSENIIESPKETSTNWPSDSARPFEGTGDVVPAMEGPEDSEPSIGTAGASFVLKSIQKSANLFKKPLGEPPADVEAWCTACSEAYWEQVHDHWSVLHQPTFSLESDPLAVTASMVIIGCWFNGPRDASDLVVNVHMRLVDNFFEELVRHHTTLFKESLAHSWQSRPGAGLDEDGPWRFEVYQAVLLNIIFAFYSGVSLSSVH